jgi:hypothetical protein
MKTKILITTLSVIALQGCGTLNSVLATKTTTTEHYHIFDIKTNSDKYAVIKAAGIGITKNTNELQENTPVPSSSKIPENPGRFKLLDPFAGSKLSMFASQAGSLGLKIVSCKDAIWTAKAKRHISGSSNMDITLCLWQYNGGYHLDAYAKFTKQTGGIMQLSRGMASAMVGSPEHWAEKVFLDTIRSIKNTTNSRIKHIEGHPKLKEVI